MSEDKKYTIEEINIFIGKLRECLEKMGETKDFIDYACCSEFEMSETSKISYWSNVMWQSPQDYAYMLTM
ncbi:hypothetical protein QYZ87_09010 [Porphyromonadaceae bacterium W3.11]|nr:hypothetical protein [Porphyromonadaceae bacterium W3.11]